MVNEEIGSPDDFGENQGFGQSFEDTTNMVVKALAEDPETLSKALKLGVLSEQEQADRMRQLDLGLRHRSPQIVMLALAAIDGSAGRDGIRADQITAIGNANGGYYPYAEKKQTMGLFGALKNALSRKKQDKVPPEMRA